MFDIFFLNHSDPNADKNWNILKTNMPNDFVFKVDDVDGILNGHKRCAELSRTSRFYVVDGDNQVFPSFKFDSFTYQHSDLLECYECFQKEKDKVYIWYSRNIVNHLKYGHGGIKLFPTDLVLNKKRMPLDFTHSFKHIKVIPEVVSDHCFNTTPFNTWRTAFREAVKLTLNNDDESNIRLKSWMFVHIEQTFSKYSRNGAQLGHYYAKEHHNSKKNLNKINDFKWLKERFDNTQ